MMKFSLSGEEVEVEPTDLAASSGRLDADWECDVLFNSAVDASAALDSDALLASTASLPS
jgi:hypothetical protein